ncbi:carboxylesterase family protein-like protein [Ophiobolus disseminans]|uniref:Carboxylic ester hydrolase n=1 Tax=Ophiobolus disseminans TaxID=1469910 RepID=A0A6A7A6H2_9PLEO|nr:carboxylesterase family protein-like protein [Ophiobolus disseminans]
MLHTAALTLVVSACLASPISYSTAPTAHVKNGTYVGLHSAEYNQDHFLGIPYAKPPVGQLRFRNPVSLDQSWSDARPATAYSGACYGYGSDQWNYAKSEDCLYINVVRPAGYEHEKLPVAFWIHGGGFVQGGGVDQRYNVSFMVQNSVKIGKPIIAVSINYRLSAWGFLSGSEELVNAGTLNLGLRDQRLALHWVQENIEAFGGDSCRVTVFGESAGAASVGFHLTAYSGRDDDLFRGAILQSGNPIAYGPLRDPLANANMYNELARRTSCANQTSPLECLRALPTEQLNTAINTTSTTLNVTGFGPIIDGDFIQKRTSIQLEAGEFVHVPIIDGANSDEGSAFSPSPVNTTEDFYRFVTTRGGVPADLANQLLAAYPDDLSVNVVASLGNQRPGPPFGAQFRRSASYFGDQFFIAPRRKTCEIWAAAGVSAYCYRFNAIPAGIPPVIGATHFQEVAFVFLNLEGVGYRPAAVPPFTNKTESYRSLARFMDSSWVSFVHDLDPNAWRKSYAWSGAESMWPAYDVANPLNYVFDANVTSYAEADTYRKEGMKLINDNALQVYLR